MRLGLLLASCCLPFSALADDVVQRMGIAEVTVSNGVASIMRRAVVSLPAGDHLLIVPARDQIAIPELRDVSGLRFGAIQLGHSVLIQDGELDTGAQAQARAALTQSEEALEAAQDALAATDGALQAAQLQMTYLDNIAAGGDNGPNVPSDLGGLLGQLSELTAAAKRTHHQAQVARRPLIKAVEAAQTDVDKARAALDATMPLDGKLSALHIPVSVEQAGEYTIEFDYMTQSAGWQPDYTLALDTQTQTVEMKRNLTVNNNTGAPWIDVAIILSTQNPMRRLDGAPALPSPVRVQNPKSLARSTSSLQSAPMADAEVVLESQGAMARPVEMVVQGMSVRYDLTDTITVMPNQPASVPFGQFGFDVETYNLVNGRFDRTAFLTADGRNETGEPLLQGKAVFYRDGSLVGQRFIPLTPQGAEITWGFGPVDHLQVEWANLERSEGDSGFISRSNDQSERLRFTVSNLSDSEETVRALYATPFSEQEDLEVDVKLTPKPDVRDIDDLRGVHQWNMDVSAGASQSVEIAVDLSWPEDQRLNWRP